MPTRTGTSLLDPIHPVDTPNLPLTEPQRTRVSHWRLFKRRVSSLFKRDTDPVSETFRALPEIKVTEDMKPTEGCPICLDNYNYHQRIKILPCLHYYHKHCIREWLCERENSCPMCRIPV